MTGRLFLLMVCCWGSFSSGLVRLCGDGIDRRVIGIFLALRLECRGLLD